MTRKVLTGAVLALLGSAGYAATPVFINEIHYDNEGTDTGEAIEIAGPAGTDLNGWKIVRYNGNGGGLYTTPGAMTSETLSGTIPDLGGTGYGAITVEYAENGLQNGAPDGIALVNALGEVVQFLSYEGVFTAGNGPAAGLASTDIGVSESSATPAGGSLQLTGAGVGYEDFTWVATTGNTFGALNDGQTFGTAPPPPSSVSLISAVQGNGLSSPVAGAAVTVEAIVIGSFQGADGLGGFFVQEEPADYDADPASSEGLFVKSTVAVAPGDRVRVSGVVTEANGLTTLNASSVELESSGNALPPATAVVLPFAGSATDRERYEGMLVYLPQTLTVTENFQLGRFGQIVLSANGRLRNPTHVALPGAAANAVAAANDLNRLLVDDGSDVQNPDPVIYPAPGLSAATTLRSGDTLTGVTGVLSYGFGAYRLLPTAEPSFVADNPRPAAPPALPGIGSLRVASFNVLNYFNGDGFGGGFPTARGAEDPAEFSRQKDKIVPAIHGLNADVIGLMEIENDDDAYPAIRDLVDSLNLHAGSSQYAYVNTGIVGTDEIRVALIYKPAKVTPVGSFAILDSSVDPDFSDTKNRPALAQAFLDKHSNKILTVAVNHLKSKGSDCNDVGDPDQGDEQGNCNLTRTKAAQALAAWLAADPTASGASEILVIGDLNAYAKEDPIQTLEQNGFVDLVRLFGGEDAYSYVFDGEAGYLDHALSGPALTHQVKGVAEWHINADEPVALDYNTNFKSAGQITSFYSADPYRSSDHDPVIVEVLVPGDLDKDGDVDTADFTRFRSALGKCPGSAGYLAEANYDGVGCVSYADYQRWYAHYSAFRAKVGL
ncbi:alkaline phosphatase [Methylocaldum marinum]|uniref:Alkaline phosphatase n=1 Tax=Methylocaldum marinum TaxID=1432792 RepID=A0A286T5P9_9GAMM|nr:ExeM/NucH family extracellular endonuclease [Methylocaldum marinum]BBA32042.1 alkaline phosphatase [Methylocaldum marinum]